ncbi:MAG: hypothetical protein ACOZBL_01045 [Patescibacteria group bacterium]
MNSRNKDLATLLSLEIIFILQSLSFGSSFPANVINKQFEIFEISVGTSQT